MTSHLKSGSEESPEDVLSQIFQKLQPDGIRIDSTDLEKLLSLWQIYLKAQDELEKAKETERRMKEAQTEEMKEIEIYVEHIRHLSDERETLIHDLESENEALKSQIVSLEQEATQAEISEMLTQQGLAEISKASQTEQVAYLLTERAHLLNEHSNREPADAEIERILEKERGEFEEELSQQRESARILSEQLKQEHEEEINALMEENSKLEDDLQTAEMIKSQLKAELGRYTDKDEFNSSLNQSVNQNMEEERKQLSEERNQLNLEQEDLEREMEEVEKDRIDLKRERDKFNKEKALFEMEMSNFTREKEKLSQMQSEVKEAKEEIEHERGQPQTQNQALKQTLLNSDRRKSVIDDEKSVKDGLENESHGPEPFRRGSLTRSSSDMTVRKIIEEKTKVETEVVQLRAQLRALEKDKDSHDEVIVKLKEDLQKSHVQQQQLQIKNRALKEELEEMEAQLDEVETKLESLSQEKQSLSEKYDTLNSEAKTLRNDAVKSYTLQDIVDILNNDKKQLSQSLETLKNKYEQTESEKTELANQNKCLTKGEHDLTNQLTACKQELERVMKEKDQAENEKHELILVSKKQEEEEKLLKAEVAEAIKMKEEYAHQVETLGKEMKDLLNKLDRSKEDLESAKVQLQELSKLEIITANLREQNVQLQSQVKSSRDELDKSKDRETMLISMQQALQKSHDGAEKSLEEYLHEIDDLKQKLQSNLQELSKSKCAIEDLSKENFNLNDSLKKQEELLSDHAEIKHALEEEKCQKDTMEVEINFLKKELTERASLADQLDKERKERQGLESQIQTLGSIKDNLQIVSCELEKEKQLRKSLETRTGDLERTISSQVSKEELVTAQEAVDKERQLISVLKTKVADLEQSVKNVESDRDAVTEQLEQERKLKVAVESDLKALQVKLATHVPAEDAAELMEELSKERAALEESKTALQQLTRQLEEERTLKTEFEKKLEDLEASDSLAVAAELKNAHGILENEQRARAECELRLQEIEQLLEEQKSDSDNLNHSLSGKIMALEKRAQTLQEDLFSAQDDLQVFQMKYDQAVKEAEVARSEVIRQHVEANAMSANISVKAETTVGDHEDHAYVTELEASLQNASAKLQTTLNELNTVKSKLCQTEAELESSHADTASLRHEITLLRQTLEATSKQLELSEDKMKTLRHELAESRGTLQFTQSQLQEKQSRLDAAVRSKDETQRDLDVTRDKLLHHVTRQSNNQAFYGEKERQKHIDKALVLEKLSQQLELDNREMNKNLSDLRTKCEILENQLQKEKLRTADKYQQRNRYTKQLEQDLDSVNNQVRHLREELQQQHAKSFRMEADNLGLAAKYQGTVARLEQEVKDLRHRHEQEQTGLREKIDSALRDVESLRGQKKEKDQELSHLKQELIMLRTNNEKLETLIQAESKQKLDLESRNFVTDGEVVKMRNQVQILLEKNAELESTNHTLELDLTMTQKTVQKMEATVSQKEAVYESSTKAVIAKADAAERRAKIMQKQLEDVTDRMVNVEKEASQADIQNIQLQDMRDKFLTLKHQLEGEKLQRTVLDRTVAELQHQVELLKQSESKLSTQNKELQHTILDLESHLSQLHDRSSSDLNMHEQMSEMGKSSLLDQITKLQGEVKELQYELLAISERRDHDVKKYEERKFRTKEKLMKARALYTAERSKYMEHMKNMAEDLQLSRTNLSKEQEWREQMDSNYKHLLREKRDLITQ